MLSLLQFALGGSLGLGDHLISPLRYRCPARGDFGFKQSRELGHLALSAAGLTPRLISQLGADLV
jgi:hypothetical protein